LVSKNNFWYTYSMKKKIPPVVWYLSLVSLFNDIASEMLYPILPIFITQILGAPVFVLGLIEGIAEGAASFFKAIFGYYSDKLQKRKMFVVGGYGASALSKIIIALSYAWPMVLFGRFIDRLGKGVRTGARDALLLETTNDENKGYIFGFHRSMDSAGAVIGPTISLLLLYIFHNNLRPILCIAAIPAFFSLLFFFYVKEAKKHLMTNKTTLSVSIKSFPKEFKLFLFGMIIFSLGNSSDTFLILRAQNIGIGLTAVIGAYILYNFVYSMASIPAGKLSDTLGPKRVFITGLIIFSLVYLGFAFNSSKLGVWVLFAVYGFYIALTDGVAKAWIGKMIDKEKAGTAYGTVYTVTSLFTVFASIIGGFLWSLYGPVATFIFAVICSVMSLFVFSFLK
jgi:MFS family permease